jgi:hypothetical protein
MKRLTILTTLLITIHFCSFANDNDTLIKGVNAAFTYSASIFPTEWQKSPISATAEPIDVSEVERSKNVTVKSLKKYPEALLTKNLKAVYWLKKMSFYDVGYGGTNSTNILYLTNDGDVNGYTDRYLEQTLHHEFSSILLRNYFSFLDTGAWRNANEGRFDYNDPEEGVGAIRNNASSQDLDSVLCKRGMLTQYALSSLENDLNTFAQNLFCPTKEFWLLVKKYPRIKKKVQLFVSFYNKINSVFTEAYFRNLTS